MSARIGVALPQMCSDTGWEHRAFNAAMTRRCVRQCDLAVQSGANQSGRRIAATEHVGAVAGQGRGIGHGVLGTPFHQRFDHRPIVQELHHHLLDAHQGTSQREGVLIETGDNEHVLAERRVDMPQGFDHDRPSALRAGIRRGDTVDVGGRSHAWRAGAAHGLSLAGKGDFRSHRLGGDPSVGRQPHGVRAELLVIPNHAVGQDPRIQGVVGQRHARYAGTIVCGQRSGNGMCDRPALNRAGNQLFGCLRGGRHFHIKAGSALFRNPSLCPARRVVRIPPQDDRNHEPPRSS